MAILDSVGREKEEGQRPPSLFEAARQDSLEMMEAALAAGQSLTEQRPHDDMTPVHVAAVHGSQRFIERAVLIAPQVVWIYDRSNLRPYDHALARRDHRSMAYISNAMYPELAEPIPSGQ